MRMIAILMGVLCATASCWGGDDPQAILKDANRAFFTDKDHEKAAELYREVLDGEMKSTVDQKFSASFNLLRCQLLAKDYKGVLAGLKALQKAFPNKVTFKNYGTIISELANQQAINEAIEAVILGANHFPEAEADVKEYVSRLKKRAASKKHLDKLKAIPYF